MYFERGSYDANASSEAQQRLQNFNGATSISSNQYFGREEDEEGLGGEGGGRGDAGGLASGDFSELEATARDYYQRFMSNPDVQTGLESFRAGALKVRHQCRATSQVLQADALLSAGSIARRDRPEWIVIPPNVAVALSVA